MVFAHRTSLRDDARARREISIKLTALYLIRVSETLESTIVVTGIQEGYSQNYAPHSPGQKHQEISQKTRTNTTVATITP